MFDDWRRQQELEDEYWARYDYINELKAEHRDPVAEYEHLMHDDMTEEEICYVMDNYINPRVPDNFDFDEDIPF